MTWERLRSWAFWALVWGLGYATGKMAGRHEVFIAPVITAEGCTRACLTWGMGDYYAYNRATGAETCICGNGQGV